MIDDPTPPDRLPRPLDPAEIRVLGALLEKEQTTPDAYPLTLNALIAACNQKTNREPVTALSPGEVEETLDRLRSDVLVWRLAGARAERWRHNLDRRWELDPAAKALLTLLLLRGPQTPGELRARSERMHAFADLAEVEETLERLAAGRQPLAVQLPRRPGFKESRWTHLAGGRPAEADEAAAAEEAADAPAAPAPRRTPPSASDADRGRLDALAERVARLEARLDQLEELLG